jgi:uncharacterized membrane protein
MSIPAIIAFIVATAASMVTASDFFISRKISSFTVAFT